MSVVDSHPNNWKVIEFGWRAYVREIHYPTYTPISVHWEIFGASAHFHWLNYVSWWCWYCCTINCFKINYKFSLLFHSFANLTRISFYLYLSLYLSFSFSLSLSLTHPIVIPVPAHMMSTFILILHEMKQFAFSKCIAYSMITNTITSATKVDSMIFIQQHYADNYTSAQMKVAWGWA